MFRVTFYVSNIKTLLKRYRPIDYRIAAITRFPPSNAVKTGDPRPRETCPPPPPPPLKIPRDDTWFWSAMTVLVIAGVGIVAAKNSPEIRDTLTLYAPWLDDLIAIIYQENMTYGEYMNQHIEIVKKYIDTFSKNDQKKECLTDTKTITDAPVVSNEEIIVKKEEEVCEPLPPPVLTLCICEIEKCMKELGDTVLNNYNTAKEVCDYYSSLVDETMQTFTLKNLKKLHHAKKERLQLVKESLKNAHDATDRLDDMSQYLDCGVQASQEEIENTKLLRRNYQELAKAAYMKFQWANDNALVRDRQWEMVETTLDKYTSENESVYPALKYNSKRPILEGDTDILLYNTYRFVNQLNGDLVNASSAMSERVNRAYKMLFKGEAEKDKAREATLQAALTARRADLDKEFKQRFEDQKAQNDKLLKDMTALQLQRHLDLLATRLTQKENEIKDKFEDMVEERVAAEKRVFALQLADMSVKLNQVEEKLNVRLKAERETRRSQELWSAGASLLAATKKGDAYVNVNKELDAIEKAAGGEDKLVLTVLKSIPKSVRQQGLVPESVLKEKYKIMERTAIKVALVEEDGGRMPVYILSWLQSLLLFMKISGIPQAEYDSPPKEPSKDLDTFDLLQRSRFWMQQDNLAMALCYVDSLKGASRLAAHYWYESARAHLEVRQAAEAILAHAAAMGLQYI